MNLWCWRCCCCCCWFLFFLLSFCSRVRKEGNFTSSVRVCVCAYMCVLIFFKKHYFRVVQWFKCDIVFSSTWLFTVSCFLQVLQCRVRFLVMPHTSTVESVSMIHYWFPGITNHWGMVLVSLPPHPCTSSNTVFPLVLRTMVLGRMEYSECFLTM